MTFLNTHLNEFFVDKWRQSGYTFITQLIFSLCSGHRWLTDRYIISSLDFFLLFIVYFSYFLTTFVQLDWLNSSKVQRLNAMPGKNKGRGLSFPQDDTLSHSLAKHFSARRNKHPHLNVNYSLILEWLYYSGQFCCNEWHPLKKNRLTRTLTGYTGSQHDAAFWKNTQRASFTSRSIP